MNGDPWSGVHGLGAVSRAVMSEPSESTASFWSSVDDALRATTTTMADDYELVGRWTTDLRADATAWNPGIPNPEPALPWPPPTELRPRPPRLDVPRPIQPWPLDPDGELTRPQRPTRPCGRPLTPPPLSAMPPETQACFADLRWGSVSTEQFGVVDFTGFPDWPATDCAPPCGDPQPCRLPSPDMIAYLKQEVRVLLSAKQWSDGMRHFDEAFETQPRPVDDALADQLGIRPVYESIYGALAVIEENRDLLDWVVCQLEAWAPRIPEEHLYLPDNAPDTGPIPNPRAMQRCMADFPLNNAIYLIQAFAPNPDGANAAGGASDLFAEEDGNNERYFDRVGAVPGPIVPVFRPFIAPAPDFPVVVPTWMVNAEPYWPDGSTNLPLSLCSLLEMAGTLLHEQMHLCYRGEHDQNIDCFRYQTMVSTAFVSAMAQRYPCLRHPCCPRTAPRFYMHSGMPFGQGALPLVFAWGAWQRGSC